MTSGRCGAAARIPSVVGAPVGGTGARRGPGRGGGRGGGDGGRRGRRPRGACPPAAAGGPLTKEDTMPVVEIEDLVKTYGGRNVVDGVNLAVEPGEILGILGRNGAGK